MSISRMARILAGVTEYDAEELEDDEVQFERTPGGYLQAADQHAAYEQDKYASEERIAGYEAEQAAMVAGRAYYQTPAGREENEYYEHLEQGIDLDDEEDDEDEVWEDGEDEDESTEYGRAGFQVVHSGYDDRYGDMDRDTTYFDGVLDEE